jgi:hypothetical protein
MQILAKYCQSYHREAQNARNGFKKPVFHRLPSLPRQRMPEQRFGMEFQSQCARSLVSGCFGTKTFNVCMHVCVFWRRRCFEWHRTSALIRASSLCHGSSGAPGRLQKGERPREKSGVAEATRSPPTDTIHSSRGLFLWVLQKLDLIARCEYHECCVYLPGKFANVHVCRFALFIVLLYVRLICASPREKSVFEVRLMMERELTSMRFCGAIFKTRWTFGSKYVLLRRNSILLVLYWSFYVFPSKLCLFRAVIFKGQLENTLQGVFKPNLVLILKLHNIKLSIWDFTNGTKNFFRYCSSNFHAEILNFSRVNKK